MAQYQNTLITWTAITSFILLSAAALIATAISTREWLTNDQSKHFGLLGYEINNGNTKHPNWEYIEYNSDTSNKHTQSLYIVGLTILILLAITVAHNVAGIVLHVLVYPFHQLSALNYKGVVIAVLAISSLVQLLAVLAWFVIYNNVRYINNVYTNLYSVWYMYTILGGM